LDLALLICGRLLGPLIGLWALFAVPLGAATYFLARYTEWGPLAALLLGFLGSGPFGVMLIGGIARTAFGEEFSLRKMLSDVKTDFRTMLRVVGERIPLLFAVGCLVVPGLLLAVRWGFLIESRVLSQLHKHRHDRRTKELINLE